jgi:hypothetical protein
MPYSGIAKLSATGKVITMAVPKEITNLKKKIKIMNGLSFYLVK